MSEHKDPEAISRIDSILRLFRPSQPIKLGPLEQRLLAIIFQSGSSTVREIIERGDFHLAYTTVMTTLNRLYVKGLLRRVAEGRAFRYTPRHTERELESHVAKANVQQLLGLGTHSPLPLSYLVEAIGEHDPRLLAELRLLVDEKRRKLRSQS